MRFFSLFWIFTLTLFGDEYLLVVNKNTPIESLNTLQVKSIFLKKQTMLNELLLVPINLSPFDEVRLSFETKVLEMSHAKLKSYWVQQHYQGQRPPINLGSFESVLAFVKKIDGAIGYIPATLFDPSFKQVYSWEQ